MTYTSMSSHEENATEIPASSFARIANLITPSRNAHCNHKVPAKLFPKRYSIDPRVCKRCSGLSIRSHVYFGENSQRTVVNSILSTTLFSSRPRLPSSSHLNQAYIPTSQNTIAACASIPPKQLKKQCASSQPSSSHPFSSRSSSSSSPAPSPTASTPKPFPHQQQTSPPVAAPAHWEHA